jgi:GAF domain-containing protein
LKAAATLCTEFGCVRDVDGLKHLLARAAATLNAKGVVVWLGTTDGADLRPLVAHGYPAQVLGRMAAIPKSADNAAAAAYRSGSMQIVHARPGEASAALVAPLLSTDGCIGALTAEVASGGERSESVQSLAVIFAAQLAGVLAAAAQPESSTAPRAASL